MKKGVMVVAFFLIVALAYFGYQSIPSSQQRPLSTTTVAAYVTAHLSELSPQKEVLGGHFYVTDMQVADGTGTVSYEDGHVAYTADFVYAADSHGGVEIHDFAIRP